MNLSRLIRHSALTEAATCGVNNALLKFRPDLRDAMNRIPSITIQDTIAFLKDNELWDDHVDAMWANYNRWSYEHEIEDDDFTLAKKKEYMDKLMCGVVRVIRRSAAHAPK